MRIDAHQHFWKFDPVRDAWIDDSMRVIRRDFYPEHLKPLLDEHGIDGCVAVQADQSNEETRFLCDLASKNDFIKAVVGWVDLRSDDIEAQLEALKEQSKLVGFRHIVQAEPPAVLYHDGFRRGIAALKKHHFTYDILIFTDHLPATIDFVNAFPEQLFVIDHMAKPKIKTAEIKEWAVHMKKLATYPNVFCKLSGMVTEADWHGWKSEDLKPYMELVLETFGPHRLMYGSDWPVCLLAAEYKTQLEVVQNFISTLSQDEQKMIMGGTARRFYGIS
jgi:L-fuconolactonase